MTADSVSAFAFSAQSEAGEPLSGIINAASVTEAGRQLQNLKLRILQLDPVRSAEPKPRRMGADDFAAFNTQLAYLATAGLPIEKSLRLIADDMRGGALSDTIKQVAVELDSGRSLPEAFALHAKQFPPLYSELVNAGIRTGNLAGMLLGLGRHLEMSQRLRAMLWRAAAYPLVVFASLLLIISFLGIFILPQFKTIFGDFRVDLPVITQLLMNFSDFLVGYWPVLLGLLIALTVIPPLLLRSIKSPIVVQQIKEILLLPIPVIGPAVWRNLLARWCDALKLGVQAGLDLPAAITLAGQAVASPRLIRDGQTIVDSLNAGASLENGVQTRWIPQTVVVVISNAARHNDLPEGLNTLSLMFQQQAEMKLAMAPTILTPILIMCLAIMIGFVIIAMFAPMIALVSSVSGPQKN
jgi:type II secretory pathway component PulF